MAAAGFARWPWRRRWFGRRSERAAGRFLRKLGYRIVAANWDALPRIARRHSPVSSACSARERRILDQHDVKAARAMRAELNALFDIAGARRAGDQVDGAGESPLPIGAVRR